MFVKLDFKVVDGIHCSIEPEQITEKHGMTILLKKFFSFQSSEYY